MKEMRCRFTKTAVLICATLVTLNSVTAADEFKNSVVNMKIDKDGNNIKVTVVTDKPYTTPIIVNPKENNNYTILLPETKNMMKNNPAIDKVSDTVNGFSIKTQPYGSSCYKGYTKIVISTSKPTNISTSAQLNSQYKEPTQVIKQPKQQPQKKIKKAPVITPRGFKNNTYQYKTISKRPSKHRRLFVTPKSKPIIVQHTYKPIIAKPIVKPQIKPIMVKPIVVKKIQKPVPNITKTKPKNISQPITNKETEPSLLIKEQKAMDNEIKTRNDISKEIQKSNKTNQESNISIGTKFKSAISNLLHIRSGLIKALLILSAIGFPIAVIFYILLINKKLRSKSVRETQYYTGGLNTGVNKEVNDEVNEDMQEDDEPIHTTTFEDEENKNISEDTEECETEITPIIPITPTTSEETEEEFDAKEPTETTESDSQPDEDKDIEVSFKDFSENGELEEDTNLLQEEKSILEEAETSFNEMLQDAETNDDVNEDTDISEDNQVADINEDAQEDIEHEFEPEEEAVSDIENEPVEEGETFEEDDIFADTEIKTEENIETPEENIENIENIEISEAEEEVESSEIIESSEEDETVETIEEPEEPIEIYEPDGFINDFEPIVPDDSIFDELITQPLVFDETLNEEALALGDDEKNLENDNDEVFEELREEYQIIDGMKVLSNTKIDDSRGFYLVDFDNVSSLVGYVDDDVFIIKTFDDFVDNQIYVKLADKISETVNRYIVKVGLFKIVVEVTNTSMTHIIDL